MFCENQEPVEFSCSVPCLTVMSIFACPKVFFYFSPFTSSFTNPPPHITSPTLSITRSISPVFCKQRVSRKLAHLVCTFWSMSWPLLYFMSIIQKDHGPLQFGLVDGPWRGNMRVFDESGQTFPPGRRRRKGGGGKRANLLRKSGIIPFAKRIGHVTIQAQGKSFKTFINSAIFFAQHVYVLRTTHTINNSWP
jgi:hypothetical protein